MAAETRARVIQAAIDSVLEKGYYRTSSNEIARRAGVTWGTIQHQFGTREQLLLEVVQEHRRALEEMAATATIEGATLEERIACLFAILDAHYGQPLQLVQIQISLDLAKDPKMSRASRDAIKAHGAALAKTWHPLLEQALGDASDDELLTFTYLTLRGFLTGDVMAKNIGAPGATNAHRDLLVRAVACAIRERAAEHGIVVE